MYFVYILECNDHSYYTGVTSDLEVRIEQHNNGVDKNSYTYTRRPVALRYWESFDDILQAIAREKQIKKWNRRKKEALIAEDWEGLSRLANRKSG